MRTMVVVTLYLGVILSAPDTAFTSDSGQRGRRQASAALQNEERGDLDCSSVVTLSIGSTYYGDNTGAPNNVEQYGQNPNIYSGGEDVYEIYKAPNVDVAIRLTISDPECELHVIFLAACDENATSPDDIGADYNYVWGTLTHFWLVVDGVNGSECPYEITVTDVTATPPSCDNVIPLSRDEANITGNTCNSDNYLFELDCGYPESGFEHWYEITLLPGSNGDPGLFNAQVTSEELDIALWLLNACENISDENCLVFADNEWFVGGTEYLTYQNSTEEPMTIYLVVDSYGYGANPDLRCGNYTGSIWGDITPTGISGPPEVIPAVLLAQNVPNPFNPMTTIRFELPVPASVILGIYDVSGRLVRELIGGSTVEAGRSERVWNGRDKNGRIAAAGVYFYRLEAGDIVETKKMVLLK